MSEWASESAGLKGFVPVERGRTLQHNHSYVSIWLTYIIGYLKAGPVNNTNLLQVWHRRLPSTPSPSAGMLRRTKKPEFCLILTNTYGSMYLFFFCTLSTLTNFIFTLLLVLQPSDKQWFLSLRLCLARRVSVVPLPYLEIMVLMDVIYHIGGRASWLGTIKSKSSAIIAVQPPVAVAGEPGKLDGCPKTAGDILSRGLWSETKFVFPFSPFLLFKKNGKWFA